MSTWPLDPTVLSAIFSAIAAAVSMLTLWFTRLKGPDIELVNTPSSKIQVIDRSLDKFVEHVPIWLDLEPIELMFVNNGSRAGVIAALRVDLKPSPGFEPFFEKIRFNPIIELPKPKPGEYATKGVFVSIREGDNSVIRVECTAYTIDWKDPQFQNIPEGSNIRAIVKDTLKANRQKLERFLDFLYSGKPLGNLVLHLTYSCRRWFKIKLKTKQLVAPIEVVNSLKDAIKGYESCLKDWDNRRSRLEDLLKGIPGMPDIFVNKLKEVLSQLSNPIEKRKIYSLPKLEDSWRQFNEWRKIQKFALEREKDLMLELRSLTEKINEFNEEATAARVLSESVGDTRIKRLNSIKAELEQRITETLSELNRLRQKLVKEIFPSK